ncbi:hypothetical protein H5410_031981 [Solanum commersonii]|uniref:Gag-pol polyprotein n=1 Tax=Solanum commersonii TaxID=4109 RepID=A0A9J5YIP1_SOLCO|nr:hypothetical protein H5410_031981 [Solanum commersonii]
MSILKIKRYLMHQNCNPLRERSLMLSFRMLSGCGVMLWKIKIRRSNVTEDLENFMEELQKVFEVMRIANSLLGVLLSPRAKVRKSKGIVFNWKQESMSVHEYRLNFTQLANYASLMVEDMRSRMSFFVSWFSRLSNKKGKASMFIGDVDIAMLMIYVQKVVKDKLNDRDEFRSNRDKTCNEFRQQKIVNVNRSSFQQRSTSPGPSSACAHAQKNITDFKIQNFQNSRARPTQCLKCGLKCHFMRESLKNRKGKVRATPRGATFGTCRGANRLYSITSSQEQENSPNVVTGMVKIFIFDVYESIDPGAILSFMTPYVDMRFDILPEQLIEPLNVSTPVGESIHVERVYRDCVIPFNHKDTMAGLVELEKMDFDVIQCMD